ncbi:hypothetical protein [Filimonas effusa]|uniref:Cytochrome B n=1 Tax=Filimonas effusa TaxID=2508721 RepID=A0A4Q1DAV7_9BACT|nr:hypothetical protein [Filimonas effusa]RXK86400.1 hypothetical protein ESB13_06235 [Filimonas effusa]
MYSILLFLHSIIRWLVFISLIYAVYRAFTGYKQQRLFSRKDNAVRHWTATIAHIQLIIGILLYVKSPVIGYFWHNKAEAISDLQVSFFALIHLLLMLAAIICITIGSAMAKRRAADQLKFRTMLYWFVFALVLIFIAVPWPFSPLVARPYLR